jgi:hypothetical protein
MPWHACGFKLASDGQDVADPSRSVIVGDLHRRRPFPLQPSPALPGREKRRSHTVRDGCREINRGPVVTGTGGDIL